MSEDIQALAMTEAERIARPHNHIEEHGHHSCQLATNYSGYAYDGLRLCDCGRDDEVKAIAEALIAWYRRGVQDEASQTDTPLGSSRTKPMKP